MAWFLQLLPHNLAPIELSSISVAPCLANTSQSQPSPPRHPPPIMRASATAIVLAVLLTCGAIVNAEFFCSPIWGTSTYCPLPTPHVSPQQPSRSRYRQLAPTHTWGQGRGGRALGQGRGCPGADRTYTLSGECDVASSLTCMSPSFLSRQTLSLPSRQSTACACTPPNGTTPTKQQLSIGLTPDPRMHRHSKLHACRKITSIMLQTTPSNTEHHHVHGYHQGVCPP